MEVVRRGDQNRVHFLIRQHGLKGFVRGWNTFLLRQLHPFRVNVVYAAESNAVGLADAVVMPMPHPAVTDNGDLILFHNTSGLSL